MRGVVVVAMLCAVQLLRAQIRIIPQDVVRKAAVSEVVSNALQFRPNSVDFGTIEEMSDVWQGRVELRNEGADTLAITQIKTTCGCLKAEIAKCIVAPKEMVVMALKYYPRGHAGKVKQRVMLYTNISNEKPSAVLSLTGVVTASEDRSDDYPYTRGVLRLRQDTVRLSGAKEVQRIAIMNGGSTVLKLAVDANLLPKGVSVRFEPAVIGPKGEGDMVVEYVPQGGESTTKGGKIYIQGLNLPPRQSAISVVVKD